MPGTDSDDEARVTTLELFFDLVFVFAFTQTTGLLTGDPTWTGMLRAVLVLAILWWAWAGYARLTNRLDPEDDVVRIAMLAAVASMLVMSLALPRVFGADGLTFAVAYIVFRVLHLALAGLAARGDPDWRRSALAPVPNVLATAALLITAGEAGRAVVAPRLPATTTTRTPSSPAACQAAAPKEPSTAPAASTSATPRDGSRIHRRTNARHHWARLQRRAAAG